MRILVVEDNKKLALSLKKGLEQEGYAVDVIFDGKAGEQIIVSQHRNYDVVVVDIMLPTTDGLTICRKIRENGIAIPLLILTARDSVEDRIIGLDSGADDYLVKPFSFEELAARLRSLLRRPMRILEPEITLKDLRINPQQRTVFRGTRSIPLTAKEFAILEYLARHPNHTITREQILNHVSDLGLDSSSNVVDVHIKNIRRKLYGHHDQELLETVRGLGYRITT